MNDEKTSRAAQPGNITLVLAEDHRVMRQALRQLLEAEPDIRIVAEAADGWEASRVTEALQPDILVTDLIMPGLSGLALATEIAQKSPRTRVVIVSNYIEEPFRQQAANLGVRAYVDKNSCDKDLIPAVRAACKS